MKNFERGKLHIVLFLIIYLTVTVIIGLSAFEFLKPTFLSYSTILGSYAIFNIVVAIFIFIFTKQHLKKAVALEDSYEFLTEQEKKQDEEKKREKIEKELLRQKTEQEKKIISEKVSDIADPIMDELFPENYFDQLLINLAKSLNIVQGVAYTINRMEGKYEIKSTYAYYTTDTSRKFEIGEGITGQVAKDQKILLMDNIPENYIHIVSGLGGGSPNNLIVIPVVNDDETIAVLEMASFEKPSVNLAEFYKQLNDKISNKVADILS